MTHLGTFIGWAVLLVALVAGGLLGCRGIAYCDTVTPDGLLNLREVGPGILRVGHPDTLAKWVALHEALEAQPGSTERPLFVQLHFDAEADDAAFAAAVDVELLKLPLYPSTDDDVSALFPSPPTQLVRAARAILVAKRAGRRVAFGCMRGRDRTGAVSALVAMALYGWSEARAIDYMERTGSRIAVLPGLLESFLQAAGER